MKEKLGGVLQHWFWISTGLVGLVSVGMWWVSSGKLIEEYEQAASQLDSDAAKITSVRNSLGTHPNAISHAEMQKLVEARTDAVMQAWTSVFERQQDILVWPTQELKQDFVDEFADLIPIELKVPFPTPEAEEKLPALRTRYQNYIGSVLPSIAEIAKAKWTANFDARRGGGMGGDMGMGGMMGGYDTDYGGGGAGTTMPGMMGPGMMGSGTTGPKDEGPLVTWSAQSQEQLLSDLFPWRGGRPTTLDVLYSQENLWILRQLMQIVALVNGDVGQRFQAKIREIDRIAIGRSVPKSAGAVSKPGSTRAPSMMGEGMDGMMESMSMDGMEEMMSGMGGAGMGGDGGAPVAVDPGDNRYVDTHGEPLTADQLRAALSSNSPNDAFMAVAKRVPVMMQFKMDQRAIPELLAICGSVPLMVEVKHVRILPPGGSSVAPASGSGLGMGMGMGGAMDMPGGDMYGGGDDMYGEDMYGGGMMGGGGGTRPTAGAFPLDMTVEVYGIIYIYNPPNSEALGIEQVDESTVIDGTAMGEGRRDNGDDDAAAEPPAAAPAAQTPPPAPAEPAAAEPPVEPEPAADDAAVEEAVADEPVADETAPTPADGASRLRPGAAPWPFAFASFPIS